MEWEELFFALESVANIQGVQQRFHGGVPSLQLADGAQEHVVVKEIVKVVRCAGGADRGKAMSAMDLGGAVDEARE